MYDYYLMSLLGELMVVCHVCVSQHGMTPLLFASQNGHVEIVNTLLADGANRDARNNVGGDGDISVYTHTMEHIYILVQM